MRKEIPYFKLLTPVGSDVFLFSDVSTFRKFDQEIRPKKINFNLGHFFAIDSVCFSFFNKYVMWYKDRHHLPTVAIYITFVLFF